MKVFEYINCVCCGFKIKLSEHRFVDDQGNFNPETQMWNDGIVQKISAGYGSTLDGDMYYLGICDKCTKENTKNGRLRYEGDYLFGGDYVSYTEEEIKEIDRKRNRENNLNDLLD